MSMKDIILQTLHDLRRYAISRGVEAEFYYQEEASALMRFANSAISLNTSEHLIRLHITAYHGRKIFTHSLITDLKKTDDMKRGVDIAGEKVAYAQPLAYEPTRAVFKESFSDESGFDRALADLSNVEKLTYFNQAAQGLEGDDLKLSGIFSNGANTIAQINTRSEHSQYFHTSDAQVTVVLSHPRLKWEALAEQSACRKSELNPIRLRHDLAFLVGRYQAESSQQLPLGCYDIVFGPVATATLLSIMQWIGFSGGEMKRGYSFLTEAQAGKRIFSKQLNLFDDPQRPETFPFRRDLYGLERKPFPIVREGVFQGFTWRQEDADEFGKQATGHSVPHTSLLMQGGDMACGSLEELVSQPRAGDLLYVPTLHYMNIVNPSKGVITSSSRFGALLLKKGGSLVLPYNVRLTQSLLDIFGDRVAWNSRQQVAVNTSSSYGARNPTALVVPQFVCVEGLEISHSNSSF
jgi:predicted Zn-dependent protease